MRAGCGRVVSSLANGGDPGGEGVSVKEGLFFHVRYARPFTTYMAACPVSPRSGAVERPGIEPRTAYVPVSGVRLGQERRAVKPSAQPTLVRTQHLPHAAKTPR